MKDIDKLLSEIPESEKTSTVLLLLEIIADLRKEVIELKDEVVRLKGNPRRPKLKPSVTIDIDKKERKKSQGGTKKKALEEEKEISCSQYAKC